MNSYGHDLPAEARFAGVGEERWAGRRLDRRGRPDLAELIRAIDAIRGDGGGPAIPRLRFVTSHPWDLSDRLVRAMADCPSVCEALHLPVQSGDDAVLRRMGRQYSIAHYRERLERIREAVPGIAISTDVIVGFCGETDAQHEATLELLRAVRYEQVFAAAYSPRPGNAGDTPPGRRPGRREAAAAQRPPRPPGDDRLRAQPGAAREPRPVLVDAVARPRAHDHEDERRRRAAARPRWRGRTPSPAAARRDGPPVRPLAREQARPPAGPAGARRAGRRGADRGRRPVQPPRRPRVGRGRGAPRPPRPGTPRPGRRSRPYRRRRAHRDRQDRPRDRDRPRDPGGGPAGRVISADSRQVYRGMDVGTAKPTLEERRGVPHHGLDLVEPDEPFSVADFVDHAAGVLAELAAAGGVAILAGGTGFWIRAVARRPRRRAPALGPGDAARPRGRPGAGRAAVSRRPGFGSSPPACRGDRPPQSAPRRAGAGDRHARRRRAAARSRAATRAPSSRIGLDVADHALHRAWIARRAEAQLDGGILPEAEALRARFDPGLPAFSAIGYREAWDLLDGRLDRARLPRGQRPPQRRLRPAPADLVPP